MIINWNIPRAGKIHEKWKKFFVQRTGDGDREIWGSWAVTMRLMSSAI